MAADLWIPIEQTNHGHLYTVDGRNTGVGLYDEKSKSFYYIRYKWGDTFLDSEEHWGCGAPHGTCKPLKDKGPVDIDLEDKDAVEKYMRDLNETNDMHELADSLANNQKMRVFKITKK